ncbi:bZIP transcription factor [Rhodotorula toruloides NP11]|uniref:BZIP transcription factor n=1 Tax=Rhodotorula toruloides (strain NP11) TaxID=1130832 RepID=M7WVG5_RHOT1|nr:bZIP transcription factor [Rhodotorula toruloides NP11]EMS24587.1 bZIP transcription factor [Rhodotorula toruloides NP11]
MDSPATTRSRKRTASPPLSPASASLVDDDTAQPLAKKRAPRSTAAEKHARKQARMERNRIAAQVSRDRKKQHTDFLEARVAELEAQLASQSPSTSLTPTPSRVNLPLAALPARPTATDPLVAQLRKENESLKTQLALEQLQSQSLQIRLSSLETKFGRLERLLSQAATSTSPATQAVEPETTNQTLTTETDSSRLVAREVDLSLQRKLSHPSSRLASRLSASTSPASTSSRSPSTRPSRRPTLSEILSSIQVPPSMPIPSSTTTTSSRLGQTGRKVSAISTRRRFLPSTTSRRRILTSSTSCDKTLLRARRLRLRVRQ